MDNDIFNILYGIDKTYSPYEVLFRGMFYVLSTSIGIIGSQGIEDLAEGDIVGDELFGIHLHLVLLYKATEAVDLNNPWVVSNLGLISQSWMVLSSMLSLPSPVTTY